MQTDRTFFVLASGGLLGAAIAGVVCATRRARRASLWCDWRIGEADLLLDLARLA